jgi:hypothetical protein
MRLLIKLKCFLGNGSLGELLRDRVCFMNGIGAIVLRGIFNILDKCSEEVIHLYIY